MPLPDPQTDNYSSPQQPQDVGVRISKPGFSVNTAPDEDLIFSSAWPSLPVAYDKVASLGNLSSTGGDGSGNYQLSYNHNLGFYPFTKVWVTINGLYESQFDMESMTGSTSVGVDKSNVYVYLQLGQDLQQRKTFNNVTIRISCYLVDLTSDIDYPSFQSPTIQSVYDPNFGIKISKAGKSTLSTDLRDYVLHSRCQSPLILATKTQKTSTYTNGTNTWVQYTSDRNYRSWVFGWVQSSVANSLSGAPAGYYGYAPYNSQTVFRTFTNGITSYIILSGTSVAATLIILRDPMFATTTINATY